MEYISTQEHARQKDSNSCGVYVLKLAEHYLKGKSLKFKMTTSGLYECKKTIGAFLLAQSSPSTVASGTSVQEPTTNDDQYHLRDVTGKKSKSSFIYPSLKSGKRRYCICDGKNDGSLYWQCDTCEQWFHPTCLGEDSSSEPIHFKCLNCKPNQSRKRRRVQIRIVPESMLEKERSDECIITGEDVGLPEVPKDEESSDEDTSAFIFDVKLIVENIEAAYTRVTSIITGQKSQPWMKRHNLFKRGIRSEPGLYGYGFSLFGVKALILVEMKIKNKFFTNRTSNPYRKHGQILGLTDEKLKEIFVNDRHLAAAYIKEVCVKEALAAIVEQYLNVRYLLADKECKEVEGKSYLQALKNGTNISYNRDMNFSSCSKRLA